MNKKIKTLWVVILLLGVVKLFAQTNHSSCNITFNRGEVVSVTEINPTPFVTVASNNATDILSAINQIKNANGGTLYFPSGTYIIEKEAGKNVTNLTFSGLTNFKMIGDGNSTVLRLAADSAFISKQVRLININGCANFHLANMRLEGQRTFMGPSGTPPIGEGDYWSALGNSDSFRYSQKEQQSNVFLRAISGSTYINQVTFREAGGDGVNMAGMKNVVIANCDLDSLDRNGITLGGNRGTNRCVNIRIQNNRFGKAIDTQQIDLEMHGSSVPYTGDLSLMNENLWILDNVFEHQLPEDTIDGDQRSIVLHEVNLAYVARNTVGNVLSFYHAVDNIAEDNILSGVQAKRKDIKVKVSHNVFNLTDNINGGYFYKGGIDVRETAAEVLDVFVLSNNLINSTNVTYPIFVHDVDSMFIEDNVFGTVTGATNLLSIQGNRTDVLVNEHNNNLNASDIKKQTWGNGSIAVTNDSQGACAPSCLYLDIDLWLEGVFEHTTSSMSTNLYSKAILPGGQPYHANPWNYTGQEGANWSISDYPRGTVDWVLLSFRNELATSSTVLRKAALLFSDGRVVLVDGCLATTQLPDSSYYVVVEHRNHVGVMSATPVPVIGGRLVYDFRNQDSYNPNNSATGQKELTPGAWAMIAGDIDQSDLPSYDVNVLDKNLWQAQNGTFDSYENSDVNQDGDVNGLDRILWRYNSGIFSAVPR